MRAVIDTGFRERPHPKTTDNGRYAASLTYKRLSQEVFFDMGDKLGRYQLNRLC